MATDREPLDQDEVDLGNEILDAVREAVKKHGWDMATCLAIQRVTSDAEMLMDAFPNGIEAGKTVTITKTAEDGLYRLVQGMAVLTALVAEKAGEDLRAHIGPSSRPIN